MICGGAEEMHFTHAAVFDILYATSRHFNDRPGEASRPFDADRDGLVVAEGAATLVLEEEERARRRGAHIHGEVIGFGTSCDGQHVTQPSADGLRDQVPPVRILALVANPWWENFSSTAINYLSLPTISTLKFRTSRSMGTTNRLHPLLSHNGLCKPMWSMAL